VVELEASFSRASCPSPVSQPLSMSTGDSQSKPYSPYFEVKATRNGYLGAFATVDIPRGTLVLDETPLFTLDAPLQAYLFQRAQSGKGGGPTPAEGEEEEEPAKTLDEFLDRAIRQQLSWKTEEQRRHFWDLANTRDELPPAFGIFATNAVQYVHFSSPVPASFAAQRLRYAILSPIRCYRTKDETGGLFLLLSRINSSCRPTLSRPRWDPSTTSTKLYAYRDISVGEQLTWTYLNVLFEFAGVEERKAEMLRVFEFECACDACSGHGMSEEDRRKSEKRLMQLRRLKERMRGVEVGEADLGRVANLKRMSELSREEKLYETAERLEQAARERAERLAGEARARAEALLASL
jgi:hypothetical protein